MLRVLSISNISNNRTVRLKKEIIDLLGANIGDEALFILDKNGIINIRKFRGDVILGKGEKYISSSRITGHHTGGVITVTSEIRHITNADIGDQLLILYKNGNVILRNNVILGQCSTDIFNKNVGALLIGLTTLVHPSNQVQIPQEIVEILGLSTRDKVVFSLDEYGNIIVSNEIGENLLLQEPTLMAKENYFSIYLIKSIRDFLSISHKVLWFFDEEGNVIIKNDLLHDNCVQ